MVGPMGYDKAVEGLRGPNEIDGKFDEKRGPLIGLKCVGNSTSDSCWYCIATDYDIETIKDKDNNITKKYITINECSCDWYRDGSGNEGRIQAKYSYFLTKCPMYSKKCL